MPASVAGCAPACICYYWWMLWTAPYTDLLIRDYIQNWVLKCVLCFSFRWIPSLCFCKYGILQLLLNVFHFGFSVILATIFSIAVNKWFSSYMCSTNFYCTEFVLKALWFLFKASEKRSVSLSNLYIRSRKHWT
jgi:hypothetical protein